MIGRANTFVFKGPVVLRPLEPRGFRLETPDGQVLFKAEHPLEEFKFHVVQLPDAWMIDLEWIECEL